MLETCTVIKCLFFTVSIRNHNPVIFMTVFRAGIYTFTIACNVLDTVGLCFRRHNAQRKHGHNHHDRQKRRKNFAFHFSFSSL